MSILDCRVEGYVEQVGEVIDLTCPVNWMCGSSPIKPGTLREPRPPTVPLTSRQSFPGSDIIAFDMDNLDQIVEGIAGKETGTKW
jgi:hypothetical protein